MLKYVLVKYILAFLFDVAFWIYEIKEQDMKKISYEQIISGKRFDNYSKEAEYILSLIDKGLIKPVISSPKNGKYPALYTRYWLIEEEKDYTELIDELRNSVSPIINIDYYLKHINVYEKERKYVTELSEYLIKCKEELSVKISENERSFAIWGKEKFLSGKSYDGISAGEILKHCGIEKDYLNTYRTAEPLAYYSCNKDVPQNILILENLDPFYSIRRLMTEGNNNICGTLYGTLVYGGGKRVIRAFEDFEISAEPYMREYRNHLFYVGDLDYEGISIYESLVKKVKEKSVLVSEKDFSGNSAAEKSIRPCIEIYNRMLDKVCDIEKLPVMKNQNVIDITEFTAGLTEVRREKLKTILANGKYIPQEILCVKDYRN